MLTSSGFGYCLKSLTISVGIIVIAMFLYPYSIAISRPYNGYNAAVLGFKTFSLPTLSITSSIGVVLINAEPLPPTP